MTKKERRDVKDALDLLIRCERVITNLIKDGTLVDKDILRDLKLNGVTDVRSKLDDEKERQESKNERQ